MNSNKSRSKKNKKNKGGPFNPSKSIVSVVMRDTVPDSIRLPMKYYDNYDLSGAVLVDEVMNLNSIFDPDRTGVGHQPLGHDQWGAFYNRYRVDCVDIIVDFVNLSSTAVTDVQVHANNDATAISTNAQYLASAESPFTWVKLIATSGGNNIWRLTKRISLAQITGVTEEKYVADDLYAAQFGASPTEVIALHLAAKDFSFTTNIQMKVRITATYWVTLFDRLQLALS